MLAARHSPKMPGHTLALAKPGTPRRAARDEIRTALDTILVAAANLQHYRHRLTPEDHAASVRDIEQAAEQIAAGMGLQLLSATGAKQRGS